MTTIHVPVLLKETLQYLVSRRDGVYVDATLGTGGHFTSLSEQLDQNAILIGIDTDPSAINYCSTHLSIKQKYILINSNFESIKAVCFRSGYPRTHGILMDLGMSSFTLDNPDRGLSYSVNGPLDMRFSPDLAKTASDIINTADQSELVTIFKTFGEERNSRSIARAIIDERQINTIKTTGQLAEIIRHRTHPLYANKTLSRIFQALRIVVNRELEVLKKALKDAIDILEPDGRIVIITYHSLEDRIVKQYFKTESTDCVCPPEFPICQCSHKASIKLLTAKPILPGKDEIRNNSRARSAKLRAAKRI